MPERAHRLLELAVGVEDEQPVAVEDLGHVHRPVVAERDRDRRPLDSRRSRTSGSSSLGSLGSNSPQVLARRAEDVDGARAPVGHVEVAVLGVLGDVERDDRLRRAEAPQVVPVGIEDADRVARRVDHVDVGAVGEHADRTLHPLIGRAAVERVEELRRLDDVAADRGDVEPELLRALVVPVVERKEQQQQQHRHDYHDLALLCLGQLSLRFDQSTGRLATSMPSSVERLSS